MGGIACSDYLKKMRINVILKIAEAKPSYASNFHLNTADETEKMLQTEKL